MLDILAITGPIYLTIGLGFVTVRQGLFSPAEMRIFGKFVINLALPALLFNALAQRPLGEILNGPYLLVYAAGSLLTLGLGWLWARRAAGQDGTSSAYYAMGMACCNSGFVGYPIALLTIGPAAGVMLGLNMIVENLLLIPLLLASIETSQGRGGAWHQVLRQTFFSLLRNPMVMGLLAGFTVSLSGWPLPAPVARTVTLFAQASGALSLFVIGGTLVGLKIQGLRAQVAQIAAGKLLLHPLAVLGALLLLEAGGLVLAPQQRIGVVLTGAMPMLGIYPILAQKHGREGLAAAALLGATAASFVTISAVLWMFQQVPGWGH